jgi:hypothetical protein
MRIAHMKHRHDAVPVFEECDCHSRLIAIGAAFIAEILFTRVPRSWSHRPHAEEWSFSKNDH